MTNKKSTILLIIFAVILLCIVIVIASMTLTASPTTKQQSYPYPTRSQASSSGENKNNPSPTLADTNSIPPVHYDDAGQASLLDKVEKRQPLSTDDAAIKTIILSLLPSGEQSGTLYQSENVSIDYLFAPDVFQVEILTTNIDQAKKEAHNWFLTKGLSQKAICNYPVQFYINFDIAQQLRGKNIDFNPLAPGCQ